MDKELKKKSLAPFDPLTNFEIKEYFKDEKDLMVFIQEIIYQN